MKISLALHCSGAVLFLLLLSEPLKQGAEAYPVSCCQKTSNTNIRKDLLKYYRIQEKPLCPVNAVRFVTIRNRTICSDPSSPWAIKTMHFLDAA